MLFLYRRHDEVEQERKEEGRKADAHLAESARLREIENKLFMRILQLKGQLTGAAGPSAAALSAGAAGPSAAASSSGPSAADVKIEPITTSVEGDRLVLTIPRSAATFCSRKDAMTDEEYQEMIKALRGPLMDWAADFIYQEGAEGGG